MTSPLKLSQHTQALHRFSGGYAPPLQGPSPLSIRFLYDSKLPLQNAKHI